MNMTKQLAMIAAIFLLSSCSDTPVVVKEPEKGIKDTCAEYVYLTKQEIQGWGRLGTYSDGSMDYREIGTLSQYICLQYKK